ncbi:PRC-barrel domain-containing protein [Halalkalibacter kiskunsagensis]|uniref:PRC-barrel domain-containing protein n=1 Tax=Halalkalibacter kiskunsagensis TaxID=1548599 RepID=A0ABV6KI48_9BACI
MYLKSSNLQTFSLLLNDGKLGSIDDFYFEASNLTILYFSIDTSKSLFSKNVLLSSKAFTQVNIPEQTIEVNTTKEQLKNSPKSNTYSPISIANEEKQNNYSSRNTNLTDQMSPPMIGGDISGSPMNGISRPTDVTQHYVHPDLPKHVLRTSNELKGCTVYAKNNEVGKIIDLVIDHKSWEIRFFEIEIGGFLSKQVVPLSTNWISEINWTDGIVTMNRDKQEVEGAHLFEGDFRSHVEAGQPQHKDEAIEKDKKNN